MHTKISAFSVGEVVFVKITRIDAQNTNVYISSKSRYGISSITDAIKNRLNVFDLIEKLKKCLSDSEASSLS